MTLPGRRNGSGANRWGVVRGEALRQKECAGQVGLAGADAATDRWPLPAEAAMRQHRNFLPWIMVTLAIKVKIIIRPR